jgi:hypothetical protein
LLSPSNWGTPVASRAIPRVDRFGGPANSESPVTLRPHLAEGVPFRRCNCFGAPMYRRIYPGTTALVKGFLCRWQPRRARAGDTAYRRQVPALSAGSGLLGIDGHQGCGLRCGLPLPGLGGHLMSSQIRGCLRSASPTPSLWSHERTADQSRHRSRARRTVGRSVPARAGQRATCGSLGHRLLRSRHLPLAHPAHVRSATPQVQEARPSVLSPSTPG